MRQDSDAHMNTTIWYFWNLCSRENG